MSILEIMTIVVCVLIVVGVAGLSIYRRKTGKTSCSSDCASCKHRNECQNAQVENDESERLMALRRAKDEVQERQDSTQEPETLENIEEKPQ